MLAPALFHLHQFSALARRAGRHGRPQSCMLDLSPTMAFIVSSTTHSQNRNLGCHGVMASIAHWVRGHSAFEIDCLSHKKLASYSESLTRNARRWVGTY